MRCKKKPRAKMFRILNKISILCLFDFLAIKKGKLCKIKIKKIRLKKKLLKTQAFGKNQDTESFFGKFEKPELVTGLNLNLPG